MDLDIKELRKDEQVEELEVRLPAAVWSERLEKELETLAERANLPGFRPGKAPRALLLRRYGDEIRNDLQDALVRESLQQILEERGIRTLRTPRVEGVTAGDADGLVYRVTCERMPEIGKIELSEFSFEALDLEEVPTEAIDEEVGNLAERNRQVAKVEEERGAREGELLLVHTQGTVDGAPHPQLQGPAQIVPGRGAYPEPFEKALVGMRKGEEKTIPLPLPEEHPRPGGGGEGGADRRAGGGDLLAWRAPG